MRPTTTTTTTTITITSCVTPCRPPPPRSSYDSLEGGDSSSHLDEVNLFACISIVALPMIVPFIFIMDGPGLINKWGGSVGRGCGEGVWGECKY